MGNNSKKSGVKGTQLVSSALDTSLTMLNILQNFII